MDALPLARRVFLGNGEGNSWQATDVIPRWEDGRGQEVTYPAPLTQLDQCVRPGLMEVAPTLPDITALFPGERVPARVGVEYQSHVPEWQPPTESKDTRTAHANSNVGPLRIASRVALCGPAALEALNAFIAEVCQRRLKQRLLFSTELGNRESKKKYSISCVNL